MKKIESHYLQLKAGLNTSSNPKRKIMSRSENPEEDRTQPVTKIVHIHKITASVSFVVLTAILALTSELEWWSSIFQLWQNYP